MHGELTLKILEAVGESFVAVGDVLTAIATTPYGSSVGRFSRRIREIEREREKRKLAYQKQRREQQRYWTMIYKLKEQGLLKERVEEGKKKLFLTLRGKKKLDVLKNAAKNDLPSGVYTQEQSLIMTIVAFDVPERERHKRSWLRGVLKNLGLTMIQQSLWMGRVKIPKEFVDDLAKLKLLEAVEIFEITKTGTLHHLA